jgi:sugar O-acyltransferase (sialic acid O-acetyltransferase NeuD family)
MSSILLGLYGTGGCARGVMPICRVMPLPFPAGAAHEWVFIDERAEAPVVNGQRVLTHEQFLAEPADDKQVAIAIARSDVRARLAERCTTDGLRFIQIVSPSAIIMDDVEIGEGCIVSPLVTLTSNIRIGRHFQANLYSYVEHDCVIGDYVTFAPGAKCNGNVVIEDHAYIGSGAVLRQGKPGAPLVIGRGAVVGMGAVVTRSVPPGVTVVGNPARPLMKA